MRHSIPILGAGIALALVLSGCAGSGAAAPDADAAQNGEPVTGGTLVFADVVNTTNFQTQKSTAYPQANILNSVLDRLTYFDAESGEPVPWIASEFSSNDTATEFTFVIRDGVTFSDGSVLDAAAVKANIELLAFGNPDAQIPAHIDFAFVDTVTANDDTVVVTLSEPNSNFLRATSGITAGLVSLATIGLDNAGQSDISRIVGSGPFVYESIVPEQELVFSSRDDYGWAPENAQNQGAAYIDTLVIRAVPEVGLRAGAVQSGQVDVVRGLQPADEAALAASGAQVIAAPGVDLSANILGVRASGSEIVDDVRVRQALQIGFDREELASVALSDSYQIAGSILNHGSPGFVDLAADLEYDPERAGDLLDDAGWELGSDGIRHKDGQELKLTVAASSNSVVIKPALEFIAQQWRELGVVLDNRAGDNTFATGAFVDPEVPLIGTRFFNWGAVGTRFDDAEDTMIFHADDELTKSFTAERATTDPALKNSALEDAQRRIAIDEALVILLWDEVQVHGAASDVHIEFNSGTAPDFHGAWKTDGE